ncbi:MAG: RteC domain-containing protein, partial [Bacteroidota bacterium]
VRENPFPDKAAEIRYFKRITPYFYGHLFYFKLLYNLEIYRITELKEGFRSYLENKLGIVKRFLFKYGILHRYYYSLQQHWDEELFVQEDSAKGRRSIYCAGSLKISQVLACRKFSIMLKRELSKPVATEKEAQRDRVECKFSKSAVVEFATTVFESQGFYVNGQPATQEYIKKRTEQYFNIVVENFSELDNANRSRKGDITPFFTKLKECAVSRAERLDNSNRLKKRSV